METEIRYQDKELNMVFSITEDKVRIWEWENYGYQLVFEESHTMDIDNLSINIFKSYIMIILNE